MIVVCDSSPVIALALLDRLNLLDGLFHEVIIPRSVFNELTVAGKPEASRIRDWAKNKISEAMDKRLLQAFSLSLDAGESEAMSLYWEKNADFLLIDEKKGRRIAMLNNIKIIGSLGILILAKQKNIITSVKPLLDDLQSSYIRISDELYRKALSLAGE
ncbi:MAG: DUF3368 domain-containing protein [Tannerella sp.]|jgi:predicted nucleic acid-binding protein|nr:DUF3368 domain-containing protein [Tannerella sp.]